MLTATASFVELVPMIFAAGRMADKDCNDRRAGLDVPLAKVFSDRPFLIVRQAAQWLWAHNASFLNPTNASTNLAQNKNPF